MKLKKEYAIILLVIIGLSVYIYSRTSDRISYDLPQIEPIEMKSVTRISIDKQDGVIALTRDNGGWIVGQRGYPADTGNIENLLKALDRFRVTDLVSSSRNYPRYSLDRKSAIELKAWSGQDLVRSFRVGKQASTYRNSYVKLSTDPNIYLSKTNLRQVLDKEPADFQDKVVLRFEETKLREIVVQGRDSSVVLTRKKSRAKTGEEDAAQAKTAVWSSDGGQDVDAEPVDKLLASLDGLTCSSYVEDRQKDDFDSPDFRLSLKNGQKDVLALYLEKGEEEKTRYLGTTGENSFPFVLSRQKGEDIVEALNTLLNS